MLHRNIIAQEFVLAKPSTIKPAPRKAPAAPKEAMNASAVAKPAPVKAALPVKAPAEPEPNPVVQHPEPVSEPAPVAAAPALPVISDPIPLTNIPLTNTVAQAAKTKGAFNMSDPMETVKTYAAEAKTRIQGAVAEMNEKAKTAMEKSAKAMEEMGALTKGNLEALVESSKLAAKGMESMGQEAVEFSRQSFEKSSATFKSFAAVKTPAEFFQLHSDLMSTALDSMASVAAKNSETFLKLAGEVSQPISNRVAIVSEKIKALAA